MKTGRHPSLGGRSPVSRQQYLFNTGIHGGIFFGQLTDLDSWQHDWDTWDTRDTRDTWDTWDTGIPVQCTLDLLRINYLLIKKPSFSANPMIKIKHI